MGDKPKEIKRMVSKEVPTPPPFSRENFTKFLLETPLYQKVYTQIPNSLPASLKELLPENLYYYCVWCQREQPFKDSLSIYTERDADTVRKQSEQYGMRNFGYGDGLIPSKPSPYGVYYISYQCSICSQKRLQWWVNIMKGDLENL